MDIEQSTNPRWQDFEDTVLKTRTRKNLTEEFASIGSSEVPISLLYQAGVLLPGEMVHTSYDFDEGEIVRDLWEEPNSEHVLGVLKVISNNRKNYNNLKKDQLPPCPEIVYSGKEIDLLAMYASDPTVVQEHEEYQYSLGNIPTGFSIPPELLEKYRSFLRAGLFEHFAYDFYLREREENEDIAVVDNAYSFYRARYPLAPQKFNRNGLSLLGVSIPDYMITQDGKIHSHVEASLSEDFRGYYLRKYNAFKNTRKSKYYSDIYEDTNIVFVVPNTLSLTEIEKFKQNNPGTDFKVLPFGKNELDKLIDGLDAKSIS